MHKVSDRPRMTGRSARMVVVGRIRVAAAVVGALAILCAGCVTGPKMPSGLAAALCNRGKPTGLPDVIVFPRNGVSDTDLHRFITTYTPRRCRVRRTAEGYQNGGTLEGVKVLMQLDIPRVVGVKRRVERGVPRQCVRRRACCGRDSRGEGQRGGCRGRAAPGCGCRQPLGAGRRTCGRRDWR